MLRNMKCTTIILTGFIIIITQARCCLSQSHYGTEFVFGFPPNHHCQAIYVSMAAFKRGTYNLTVPFLSIADSGTIQSNLTERTLSCSITKFGTFTEFRGIFLKTSIEVAVYVTNYFSDTAESFLVLPVPETGKQYSIVAYQPFDLSERGFVLVAASTRETNGSIYDDTSGLFVQNFSLNTMEVFQLSLSEDMRGLTVITDKQVAVITGTTCANIPHDIRACDIVAEQMIPVMSWDTMYIASPTVPKKAYELRVTKVNSSESGRICFHNQTRSNCEKGSTISIRMGEKPTVIVSDSPVSVVQFGFGNNYPPVNVGDPFMTVIPGLKNFLNEYFFAIPNVYKDASNHLSIIIPMIYTKGLVLDGMNLTFGQNDMINVSEPLNNYTVAILNVSSGYHHLYHAESYVTFGLLIYGLGTNSDKYVGFGYPAGMRLSQFDTPLNIPATSLPNRNTTDAVLNGTKTIENTTVTSLGDGNETHKGLSTTKATEKHNSTISPTNISATVTLLGDGNETHKGLSTIKATEKHHTPTTQTKNKTESNGKSTSLKDTKNKAEKGSLGMILGGAFGGLFALLLLACLVFILAKKRAKSAVQPEDADNTELEAGEDTNDLKKEQNSNDEVN